MLSSLSEVMLCCSAVLLNKKKLLAYTLNKHAVVNFQFVEMIFSEIHLLWVL